MKIPSIIENHMLWFLQLPDHFKCMTQISHCKDIDYSEFSWRAAFISEETGRVEDYGHTCGEAIVNCLSDIEQDCV